jgi:hypothetical protein
MIQIKRPAEPAFLADPTGRWYNETENAKTHYKNGAVGSFEFKLYNDSMIKDELKKVFTKCAYCESSYGAVYDGDVEHFRPKGKVKEKTPQTPGYYWLANNWDNLFLACQQCNQKRKHILYGDDKLIAYGKLDQFPLDNEDKRMIGPDASLDEEEKVRLLINPCKDDPSEHLAYEKEEAVIIPLTKKGKSSIEVYVLQRPILVQERKKQLLKLLKQMLRTKKLLVKLNNSPNNSGIKTEFEEELDNLMDYTKAEEVYAGMSRYFVKEFLKDNGLI